MLKLARTLPLLAVLISPGFLGLLPECEGQNRMSPAGYDHYALALASVLNSGAEASKLPDIPQRVTLLIKAAKALPVSQHDEAVRLLDIALSDLKQWGFADKASWYRRHTAAELRNDLLVVYARVDPEKTAALQKEYQAEAKLLTPESSLASLKSADWFTQLRDRQTLVDQAAKIALSLIDTDPDKALKLVVQSLQGGIVSEVLLDIVQKLIQAGNRGLLNRLEISIAQALGAQVTFDPFSLGYASVLVQVDKDIPTAVRNTLISFLMRSVQAQSNLIRESGEGGIDPFYIRTAFTYALLNVRPVISQHTPEQLLVFEQFMEPIAQQVPTETKIRLQAFQPETFSEPRERLNDILRDPNPGKRDLRLIRLVSDLLRKESADVEKSLELAADAVSGFSDPDVKSAYSDLLIITRIDAFVKEKKFIEAQEIAGSISSLETRAWALLALSTVAAKSDRVLGFELISNALQALDKASPSPHKVQLALAATGMLAKSDPQRAFDTFSTASKYANSSVSRVDPPAKPAVGFGVEARIGDAQTRLGVFPESLAELEINPSLAVLGTTDWFRADQIVDNIREPSLRLQLKLQFAGAVLAKAPKPIQKGLVPKPSARK